jgi:hypothetical protein
LDFLFTVTLKICFDNRGLLWLIVSSLFVDAHAWFSVGPFYGAVMPPVFKQAKRLLRGTGCSVVVAASGDH